MGRSSESKRNILVYLHTVNSRMGQLGVANLPQLTQHSQQAMGQLTLGNSLQENWLWDNSIQVFKIILKNILISGIHI